MGKVIERRRNIYIYILATILFSVLGMARIDAYAGVSAGKYNLYLASPHEDGKSQLHNSGEQNEKIDLWYGSSMWIIESYSGGYSIRYTGGSQPYITDGDSWNNLKGSRAILYLEESGDYYYIRNTRGKYLYTFISNDRYQDRLVGWTSNKNDAELIRLQPEGYSITFNVNGGSTSISSQTVSTISLPSPGSKTGYTFDGWYNGNTRETLINSANNQR